jgi:hypothetical protein
VTLTSLADFSQGTVPIPQDFQLLAQTTYTIGPNTIGNPVSLPVTFPAYQLTISTACPSGMAWPVLGCQVAWNDPVSGDGLDQEFWSMFCSDQPIGDQLAQVTGRGPSRTGLMTLEFYNLDVADTITYELTVYQSSRTITRADWRNVIIEDVPGLTNPTAANCPALILAFCSQQNIAASATLETICGLYSGQAQLRVSNPSGATIEAIVTAYDGSLGPGAEVPVYRSDTTSEDIDAALSLPRAPCVIKVTNNNATAQASLGISLIAQEFAS